ncbi:hypothetical protein B0O99DRAFT_703636 [Bisporella sp. PMI_857]|nr:hypothetical protein B0O99DRAFT_703636 [Bisporella sp. PMI_857]
MDLAHENFPSSSVFDDISKGLEDKDFAAQAVAELNAIYAITLKNDGNDVMTWIIDFKNDAKVFRATGGELVDVTLILSDYHWDALVDGRSSAPRLYLLNQLKLVGPLLKAKSFNAVLAKLKEKK